ncbi:MAG: sugar phosphate isomerase/epimerase [Planctomycetota bacterium]|nr:sugar phosphate isomerase/epimerase [Planctomycetota bacterium]
MIRLDTRRTIHACTALAALFVFTSLARVEDKPSTKPPAKVLRLRPALKYSMIAGELSVEEKFALAKALGFEGIEVDSPSSLDKKEVVAAAKKTGLVVHGVIDSVHWLKRFSDPSVSVREEAGRALKGAIDDAHLFGATTVLVVPGAVRDEKTENFEQAWSRSHDEIARLVPYAKEKGVKIAIEVVWNDFLTTPEQLVKYIDEFKDPTVGAYFDCSNMIKYGRPSAEWIKLLGPRLLKFDFKGYSKEKGWVAIGDGDEDWPAVRAALAEIGYDGWATAEVDSSDKEQLADVKKRMDRVLFD